MTIKPRTKTFSEFLFYADMVHTVGHGIVKDEKLRQDLKLDTQRAVNACKKLTETVDKLLGKGSEEKQAMNDMVAEFVYQIFNQNDAERDEFLTAFQEFIQEYNERTN